MQHKCQDQHPRDTSMLPNLFVVPHFSVCRVLPAIVRELLSLCHIHWQRRRFASPRVWAGYSTALNFVAI